MKNIPQELPDCAMTGAAFADSLSKKFASQGGTPATLFIALAGLIYGLSPKIGADCLMALDGVIDGVASEGKSGPSA
jgi:hypothetical protein